MTTHLRANLVLLVLTVILCSVLYPLALWGIGQVAFHGKAEGSMLTDAEGKVIGSRLIAQPFTADEYFQPRPSSASYNGAASGASNWAASNYLLRDRVAQTLGPIVKYRSGPKKGQLVAPDVETWFQKDQFGGKPRIVAQWANLHNASAQNWLHDWVAADKLNAAYIADWEKAHPNDVDKWKSDNPGPEPKPEDLAKGIAVSFFSHFSQAHAGTFPGTAEDKSADGKVEKKVEPVKEGSDIQKLFFDMWLSEHADVDLEPVPADAVMSSGSGLDPHITLDNALWQLDRVAGAWAKKTSGSETKLHGEIEKLLRDRSEAPLGGLVGVPLVNVLEVNVALRDRYQKAGK